MDEYQKLFNRAVSLGKKRNYNKAAAIFHELIDMGYKRPETYLYLGRSLHSLNRMQEAVYYLKEYLRLKPGSSSGCFFLGRSLFTMNLFKNSIPYLKKAVSSHPESIHANGFLGMAYLRAGRSDIALMYLEKAVRGTSEGSGIYKIYLGTLFVRAVKTLKSGDTDLASQMFCFLIESSFDSILPYIYMGMIERQNNNFRKALEYYEAALDYSPRDELLLYRRAVLLYKVGKREEAMEELQKLNIEPEINDEQYAAFQYFLRKDFGKAIFLGNRLLHQDNRNLDVHLMLGEAHRETGSLDIAENHFKRAIALDRTSLEGRYGLSLVKWMKGRYRDMLDELSKINVSDPGNPVSSYYSALCKCRLDYDTEETIPALQSEIRRNTTDFYLYNFLGEEYNKAGLYDLSEKWFVKAIKVNSSYMDPYRNLITLYEITNDNRKLLKAYEDYLKKSDDNESRLKYIRILYENKSYRQVIPEILYMLNIRPSDSALIRMIANSYRQIKDWGNAAVYYRQLLTDAPEDEFFIRALTLCYDKSGDSETALSFLGNAIEFLKTPSDDLMLIYGVMLYKTGSLDESLKNFRKMMDNKNRDWRVYNNMAMIYREKGLKDYSEQFFSRAEEYKNK